MSRIRVLCLLCSVLLLSVLSAHAATSYVYVSIEPKPEWRAIHLHVNGIDDLGKMVGVTTEADEFTRSWRYVPGVQPSPMMRWNQGSSPRSNTAFDINNRGWLVQITNEGEPYRVNYCKPAPCTTVKHVPTLDPRVESITNSLQVAGSYPVPSPEGENPGEVGYIADLVTNTIQVIRYPERSNTILTRLNDDGLATGYAYNDVPGGTPEEVQSVSFVYQDGAFYPFVIPGTFGNQLVAVNNRSVLVGLAFYETDILSFAKHPSGELVEIQYPDSLSTFVSDVNNRGVIAGSYLRADFLWRGFVAWPVVTPDQPQAMVAASAPSADTARLTHEQMPEGIEQSAEPLQERQSWTKEIHHAVCAGTEHRYARRLPGC